MAMTSASNCTPIDCSRNFLAHPPVLVGNIVLLALFAVPIPIFLALGIKYRSSGFATAIVTGLALETVGYVGRLLLHNNPSNGPDFAVFLVGTTLGPTCICGGIFLAMPRIVAAYGEEYRSWRPTWYLFFLSALTAVSLVLELVGSVLSAVQDTPTAVETGGRVLIVGLVIQLVALIVFVLHAIFFAVALRTRQHNLDVALAHLYNSYPFRIFLALFTVATILVILRTTYRLVLVVEMLEGSTAESETTFLVLDGSAMLIAIVLLLVCFPPRALGDAWPKSAARRLSQQPPPRPVRPPSIQFPISHPNPTIRMSTRSLTPIGAHPPRTPNHPARAQSGMVDSDNLW